MKAWEIQGCNQCRQAWEQAATDALNLLGVSYQLHVRLYLCKACGAFWEEQERYANEVSKAEAEILMAQPSFEPSTK